MNNLKEKKKMEFIHIGDHMYGADRRPIGNYKAIWHNNKWNPIDRNETNEFFVPGEGWAKVGKKKKASIPVFSGLVSEWVEYKEKFGPDCLFYSLTGHKINDQDCCLDKVRGEFASSLVLDPNKWYEFMSVYKRFNELQQGVLRSVKFTLRSHREDNTIKPMFYLLYTFFYVKPYMDAVNDDEKLERVYSAKRTMELFEDFDKSKYEQLEIERRGALENLMNAEKETRETKSDWIDYHEAKNAYDNAKTRAWDAYSNIHGAIEDRIREEMLNVFPQSVRDRITFLYSKEASDLYEKLLEFDWK